MIVDAGPRRGCDGGFKERNAFQAYSFKYGNPSKSGAEPCNFVVDGSNLSPFCLFFHSCYQFSGLSQLWSHKNSCRLPEGRGQIICTQQCGVTSLTGQKVTRKMNDILHRNVGLVINYYSWLSVKHKSRQDSKPTSNRW